MRQGKDPFGFGRRKNKAKDRAQARQLALVHKLRLWLSSPISSAYEVKIAGLVSRLSKSDLTRLERAYGQPKTKKGEWNPYQLREDIRRLLPNGERIAGWIAEHSELKPKATEAEARRHKQALDKLSAEQGFPGRLREKALQKLAEPGKWPKRVRGPEGDIKLDKKTRREIGLWGPWIVANYDALHARSLVPSQATALLKNTDGDLAMIWIVRTGIWNTWVQLNKESAQPTAFVPNMLPSERRGKIDAARSAIPKLEAFRKLFDKTPGPLADYMKTMINERVGQLKKTIAIYDR